MNKEVVLFVVLLACAVSSFAKDPKTQKIPNEYIQKGFTLSVQFAAERPEYMSPSVSNTVIRGFSDRAECWERARQITKAIQAAEKSSGHKGVVSFGCNPENDFIKEGVFKNITE
ncbi:hypothetical protein ACEVAQ_07935 [Ectopseudomonas khazarica]|uniref:Uncharacterized protein n=1 Tax=Ectopseudomonas khazarica TaxID=2502979 RepID=A0ABW7MAM6_9GAMM